MELALIPVATSKLSEDKPVSFRKCAQYQSITGSQPNITQDIQDNKDATPPAPIARQPSDTAAKSNGELMKEGDKKSNRDLQTQRQLKPSNASLAPQKKDEDAFSVLAVFNLALNWFGPAKIEQHYATGCAAINLLAGLTRAEEDKRLVESARMDAADIRKISARAENSINKLQAKSADFDKQAKDLVAKSLTINFSSPTADDRKKAAETIAVAETLLAKTSALEKEVEGYKRDHQKAGELVVNALDKTNRAMGSEEARESAEKAKTELQKIKDNIDNLTTSLNEKADDAIAKLKSAESSAKGAKDKASTLK
jgi:hypothetical protein